MTELRLVLLALNAGLVLTLSTCAVVSRHQAEAFKAEAADVRRLLATASAERDRCWGSARARAQEDRAAVEAGAARAGEDVSAAFARGVAAGRAVCAVRGDRP